MATNILPRDAAAELPARSDADQSTIAPATIETSIGPVRLSIFRNPEALRERWQEFESKLPCACYQTYRWCDAWARTVANPKHAETVIAVAETKKCDLLFIMPFEIARISGLRALRWLGVDHANYNFPPFAAKAANGFDECDVSALLFAIADQLDDVSAAVLTNQPHEWNGVPNPLARLPHRPSANPGFGATLAADPELLLQERVGSRTRSSMRRKEKRLKSLGNLKFGFCDATASSNKVLELYFDQKAQRFAEMGIQDIFADPCHRAFYRDLAAGSAPEGRLEMAYLKVGAETAATLGAIHHQGRTNMLVLSITNGETARWSPGLMLIKEALGKACLRGQKVYDFGLGGGPHKDMWCDHRIELFDNFVAFRARGLLVTLPLAAKASLKRIIKSNDLLWSIASRARRLLKGRA